MSKLDDIGWRGDAELFRVLRQISITPVEANEMELWEIGVLLGADLPQTGGIDPEVWEREKGTVAERAKRIAEMKQGQPEADPATSSGNGDEVDITAQVMRQMGIRTS